MTLYHKVEKETGDGRYAYVYEEAEVVSKVSWCRTHRHYANFSGGSGLTCGSRSGREKCWVVQCVVVDAGGDGDERVSKRLAGG